MKYVQFEVTPPFSRLVKLIDPDLGREAMVAITVPEDAPPQVWVSDEVGVYETVFKTPGEAITGYNEAIQRVSGAFIMDAPVPSLLQGLGETKPTLRQRAKRIMEVLRR